MQQDAEEFYNILLSEIINCLQLLPQDDPTNRFESLLGLQVSETLTCEETDQEPVLLRTDYVNKLVCNIQNSIDHMQDGIKLGLEDKIEKYSAVLGRDAVWRKQQRLSSLSRYLCVQFMRFFWKATPDSRDHRGVKCKIMRAVSFPEVLPPSSFFHFLLLLICVLFFAY